MADGAGVPSPLVPSATGVAALESDALSPLEPLVTGCAAAAAASGTGELVFSLMSFSGDSSLTGWGSAPKISRNLEGETLRVTSRPDLLPDLRRPSVDLAGGAMALVVGCSGSDRGEGFGG